MKTGPYERGRPTRERGRLIVDVVTGKLDVRDGGAGWGMKRRMRWVMGRGWGEDSVFWVNWGITTGRGRLETGPYERGAPTRAGREEEAGWNPGRTKDRVPHACSGGSRPWGGEASRAEEAGWKPAPTQEGVAVRR